MDKKKATATANAKKEAEAKAKAAKAAAAKKLAENQKKAAAAAKAKKEAEAMAKAAKAAAAKKLAENKKKAAAAKAKKEAEAKAKAAKAAAAKKLAEAKAKAAKAAAAKKLAEAKAKAAKAAAAKKRAEAKAAKAKKEAEAKAKAQKNKRGNQEGAKAAKAQAAALQAKRKADALKEESKIDSDQFINRLKNALFSLEQVKKFKVSSPKDIVVRKLNVELGSFTRALYEVVVGGKTFFTKLLTATRENGGNQYTERDNLRKLAPQFKEYDKECAHNPLLPKLGRYFTDTEFNANGQSFHFILLEKREGRTLWQLAENLSIKIAKAQTPSQKELSWFTKIGQSLASFHLKYKTQNPNCLETLIHGDLHFGNLLFEPTKEEVSLIDYETMKIGNALLDTDRLFFHNNDNELYKVKTEAERIFKNIKIAPFNLSDAKQASLWDEFDKTILPKIRKQYDECFNQIARGYNGILSSMGFSQYMVALPYP